MTRVREVGEFPLIDRILARLPRFRSDVAVGPGDDVAAIAIGPGRLVLATCDVQVEGAHFLADRTDPRRLGRKAAAINLSDIASAGGRPTHFLLSLVLPPDLDVAFVEGLAEGLAEEAARWGADVIGGNVSAGERLALDVTLLGEVRADDLLRRDAARPGHRLLVTGTLGAAAAGLALHRDPGLRVDAAVRRDALDAFETPVPRLAEAWAIVAAGGAAAAIDVSDGLAADVGHLCDASGVGIAIDAAALPVDGGARAVAAAAGADATAWALGGGEDYELALSAPPDRVEPLARAVAAATGTVLRAVGTFVPASEGRTLRLPDGSVRPLDPSGWRHF